LGKKLVYYTSEDCEYCDEARPIVTELARELGLQVVELDLKESEETPVTTAPSVCLVDEEKGETITCVVGFSNRVEYRQRVAAMLKTRVVV